METKEPEAPKLTLLYCAPCCRDFQQGVPNFGKPLFLGLEEPQSDEDAVAPTAEVGTAWAFFESLCLCAAECQLP